MKRFIAILILSGFTLKRTIFGRNLNATVGNYTVAQLSGINVDFHKMVIFVILGFSAAIRGILIACRMVSFDAYFSESGSVQRA